VARSPPEEIAVERAEATGGGDEPGSEWKIPGIRDVTRYLHETGRPATTRDFLLAANPPGIPISLGQMRRLRSALRVALKGSDELSENNGMWRLRGESWRTSRDFPFDVAEVREFFTRELELRASRAEDPSLDVRELVKGIGSGLFAGDRISRETKDKVKEKLRQAGAEGQGRKVEAAQLVLAASRRVAELWRVYSADAGGRRWYPRDAAGPWRYEPLSPVRFKRRVPALS